MGATPSLPPEASGGARLTLGAELAALSVSVAVPLILLVAFLGWRVLTLERGRAETAADQAALRASAHIEQVLQSTRTLAGQVARRGAADPARMGCDPILMSLPSVDDAVQNAAILDPAGRFICSAIPLPDGVPPEADQEWYRRASRSDTGTVGGMQQSRVSGEWITVVSAPIVDRRGDRRGYAGIALDLGLLTRILGSFDLPAASVVTILDDHGRVIARTPPGGIPIGKRPEGAELLDSIGHTGNGHFRARGVDGVLRYYTTATIPVSGWRAVVGLPPEAVYGRGRRALLGSALISLGILAVALVGARRIALRTVRPVRAIADATAAVAAGRRDVTVPEVGPAEVARVARRFNEMALSLRASEAGLRESEARYRRLIETSAEGIVTLDANGRIGLVNRRFASLVRRPIGELLGARFPDLLAAEDRPAVLSALERSRSRGSQVLERRLVGSGDWVRFARLAISAVLDRDGKFACYLIVASDLTERRREEEELRRSRTGLRELAAGLEEARESERTRVAREIHDELGQALVGLTMDVAWIASRLPPGATELQERAAAMRALLDTTTDAVRRIAAELRPGVLDDLGLEAAVRWQAGEVKRRSGIAVAVETGSLPELDPGLSTALFRILQESLANVVRHAKARTVRVRLDRVDGMVRLEVADDGVGIAPAAADGRRHLGLLGMEERVRAWDGTLHIDSAPGDGTRIEVRVPVRPPGAGGEP